MVKTDADLKRDIEDELEWDPAVRAATAIGVIEITHFGAGEREPLAVDVCAPSVSSD